MILKNRIACRICLSASADVRFYHMKAFQLQSYYEEMINEVLTTDDDLLIFFCYQCSALLHKYHSFRELCIKSQETLKKITKQNFNISFETTLKWEQYNNKIHPLTETLVSTARLGYFEYQENDITIDKSFDDPLVNNLMEYANSPNPYYDNEENFDSKPVVGKSISESDEKHDSFSNRKTAENNSSGGGKKIYKRNVVKHLDPRKWKKVILSNEEAAKEYDERIQKQDFKRCKHVCEHCQKAFINITTLNDHVYCHSEASGNYECFICKKRYSAKYKLGVHLRLHLVKYHCLQCPQVYSNRHYTTQHEKFHEGVQLQYTCKLCDIKFQKKGTYLSHLRFVHRSSGHHLHSPRKTQKSNSNDTGDEGTYCKVCDMMFENSEAFKEHERNSDKHVTKEEDGPRKKLLKIDPHQCGKCAKMFSSTYLYNRHIKRAHIPNLSYQRRRTICEVCGAAVTSGQLKGHMNIHEGKRFPCPDCDKVYHHQGNMKRHRLLHKNPKPFSCFVCGKKFTNSSGRNLHLKTVHLKQPYPIKNRTKIKFASLGKSGEL